MSDETIILRCSCSELSHAIRMGVWDQSNGRPESFTLEVCTTGNGHGFWRRLKAAAAHVFSSNEIVYGDVIISGRDAAMLSLWIAARRPPTTINEKGRGE